MRRDLFEDFCREYVRELNRLRMEHRASLSHGRQRARVRRTRNPEARSGDQGWRVGAVRSRTSCWRSKRGRPNCSRVSTHRRCRSCCIRGWPTSIARRSGASVCALGERGEPHGRGGRHSSTRRGHRARTRWRPAENHAEGRSGGNAERGQRQQEVARYRRPPGPNKAGCGGGI